MSLREEMIRYEHLTGESAEHIPIIKIGAFLDGVDKGIEELEKIKVYFEETQLLRYDPYNNRTEYSVSMKELRELFDRHISELKVENKSEQADTEFNHKAFYEFLLNTINPNEMEKYRSMFLSSGEIVK